MLGSTLEVRIYYEVTDTYIGAEFSFGYHERHFGFQELLGRALRPSKYGHRGCWVLERLEPGYG